MRRRFHQPVPDTTITVTGIRTPPLAGHRVVVLDTGVAPQLQCPVLLDVQHGTKRVSAWAHRSSAITRSDGTPIVLGPGTIGVGGRAWRALVGDKPDDGRARFTLHLPPNLAPSIRSAQIDDLTKGARIRLPTDVVRHVTRRRWLRRWAVLTVNGVAAPVRVTGRPKLDANHVRMAQLLRALLHVRTGEQVQVARPPRRRWRDRLDAAQMRSNAPWTWARYVAGSMLFVIHVVDFVLEFALRAAFRAPTVALITTQVHAGDDDLDVARLNPATFAALGIAPGDSLLVHWCGLRTPVRALEDFLPHGSFDPAIERSVQRAERVVARVPEGMPPHLVIRLPGPVRWRLGIPAVTVVEVRRRVRPLVQRHLNQLLVPIGGLVLSSVAIEELRGWPVVAGVVVAFLVGLANLRVPRTPSGLWP